MKSTKYLLALTVLLLLCCTPKSLSQQKPRMTVDDASNLVKFIGVRTSPDGNAVLIATEAPDWAEGRYRTDIWLYRQASGLAQLTRSGRDSQPQWSPDGQWIAFISRHRPATAKTEGSQIQNQEVSQVYAISLAGGEAFPVTNSEDDVHAFDWSADSRSIYFAIQTPWSKTQKEANDSEWKDVVRYRESERGDVIYRITVVDEMPQHVSAEHGRDHDKEFTERSGPVSITSIPLSVQELASSPDGKSLAFVTNPASQRYEDIQDCEIWLLDIGNQSMRRLTRNEAFEDNLQWSRDSRELLFRVPQGSVERKYEDVQYRTYSYDVGAGDVHRWAEKFTGSVDSAAPTWDGRLVGAGRLGTEVQPYLQSSPAGEFIPQRGWPGTYERFSPSTQTGRLAFVFSSQDHPNEVFLADAPDKLTDAHAITSFNQLFVGRDLPRGVRYRWKADDGSAIEGWLWYPPGKFEAKNLRTLVLIHGGPNDSTSGNCFMLIRSDWGVLAASNDWLVLEPNYRGSVGYGDQFAREVSPNLVSRPGKDILAGVDALVRDGIADPTRLAIGGYSYGGYLTNWLITQTTRFKAAVTGAGAVEHAAEWGNDDTPLEGAWLTGGRPWEASKLYQQEAAIFQMDKVKTPTHIVVGDADVRVSPAESYALERALHSLNVPSRLLIFPGEAHAFAKNPWHRKIRYREELRWLEQ